MKVGACFFATRFESSTCSCAALHIFREFSIFSSLRMQLTVNSVHASSSVWSNHCGCHFFFQFLSSSPIRIPSSRLHQIRRVSGVFICVFSNRMKSTLWYWSTCTVGVSFLLSLSSTRENWIFLEAKFQQGSGLARLIVVFKLPCIGSTWFKRSSELDWWLSCLSVVVLLFIFQSWWQMRESQVWFEVPVTNQMLQGNLGHLSLAGGRSGFNEQRSSTWKVSVTERRW